MPSGPGLRLGLPGVCLRPSIGVLGPGIAEDSGHRSSGEASGLCSLQLHGASGTRRCPQWTASVLVGGLLRGQASVGAGRVADAGHGRHNLSGPSVYPAV